MSTASYETVETDVLILGAGGAGLRGAIAAAEAKLGAGGRVVVRPSGTEPSIRVMVEGPEADLVIRLADELAALAGERLN